MEFPLGPFRNCNPPARRWRAPQPPCAGCSRDSARSARRHWLRNPASSLPPARGPGETTAIVWRWYCLRNSWVTLEKSATEFSLAPAAAALHLGSSSRLAGAHSWLPSWLCVCLSRGSPLRYPSSLGRRRGARLCVSLHRHPNSNNSYTHVHADHSWCTSCSRQGTPRAEKYKKFPFDRNLSPRTCTLEPIQKW